MNKNLWAVFLITIILIMALPLTSYVYKSELAFTADNLLLIQNADQVQ